MPSWRRDAGQKHLLFPRYALLAARRGAKPLAFSSLCPLDGATRGKNACFFFAIPPWRRDAGQKHLLFPRYAPLTAHRGAKTLAFSSLYPLGGATRGKNACFFRAMPPWRHNAGQKCLLFTRYALLVARRRVKTLAFYAPCPLGGTTRGKNACFLRAMPSWWRDAGQKRLLFRTMPP